MSDRIRVGVVGAGYFGRFHLDAWSRIEDVDLIALCEPDAAGASEMAALYPGIALFDDAVAMVDETGPDLVDITAPPHAHLDLITALAPRVSHIICQKPFCGDLANARKAIAMAADNGCKLAIHENIRYQPWNREAKRLMDAGAIGQPYQITFRLRPGDGQGSDAYLDRQPYFQTMPRFMVHETGIHWVDTFRYFMGEVRAVHAHLARLNPAIAGEDAGIVVFEFDNGARGLFDGNRLVDHAAQNRRLTLGEMWIEGSDGVLRLDGDGRLWLRAYGENAEIEQHFDWDDHLFGGDCVYLTSLAMLQAWRAGMVPETEASLYVINQELEVAIYESAGFRQQSV
jgi:predicted dehydrogenase